ncbi:MAG: Rv1355c family protein [Myxococcota bacterium]
MSDSDLQESLQSLVHPEDDSAWQPVVHHASSEDDWRRLEALIESGRVAFVHDTIDSQLGDLVATREPHRTLGPEETRERVRAHLDGVPPFEYGVWVWYPWSRRLVHLLPEEEFRELRTSRNRNKITFEEQERLRSLKLGIAGLSVGQATAVTLALEEIGGEFRLADFDALELSNMNRLRTGVHNLGVPKAALTAREIFEINPFARVRLFSDGVTDDNIADFLSGGGNLDLLFEECDGLEMKIRLRERARELGIPVLMETSDRGMLDVERFDREPERPILHGLVGGLRADQLVGLTTYEKVPIVLQIIGDRTMSGRMAASLVDVETTLKTWPQLASAVALGGALNTDAARRIALGQLQQSGRFYVDLEKVVSDEVDATVPPPPSYEVEVAEEARRLEVPEVHPRPGPLDADKARTLVAYATLAPSGGNCQPWRFELDGEHLDVLLDRERSQTLLDVGYTASYLALGAATENIVWVARAMGHRPELRSFPDPSRPDLVCRLRLEPAEPDASAGAMVRAIAQRVTNRKLGARQPLPDSAVRLLTDVAAAWEARLQLLTRDSELEEVADLLGWGDRIRFLNKRLHNEMMGEVRWNAKEALLTRDGLDVATLELTPTDLAGMRLVSNWSLMRTVGTLRAGRGLERPTRKSIAAASAVGLLTVPGRDPLAFFRGGRAIQRVWLEATSLGLAFQPMTALLYVFEGVRAGLRDYDDDEAREIRALRERFGRLFECRDDHAEIMLFRLAVADPPSARSLRRPVDDVLTIRRAT